MQPDSQVWHAVRCRPPIGGAPTSFQPAFSGGDKGTSFARYEDMAMTKRFRQYATRRATRKLVRAVPWLGAAIALVTLGGAIRRKGFFGGTLHTALDFTPVVGTLKNLTELGLGRDLFRDRFGGSP
jgi:hypothetical protein